MCSALLLDSRIRTTAQTPHWRRTLLFGVRVCDAQNCAEQFAFPFELPGSADWA